MITGYCEGHYPRGNLNRYKGLNIPHDHSEEKVSDRRFLACTGEVIFL